DGAYYTPVAGVEARCRWCRRWGHAAGLYHRQVLFTDTTALVCGRHVRREDWRDPPQAGAPRPTPPGGPGPPPPPAPPRPPPPPPSRGLASLTVSVRPSSCAPFIAAMAWSAPSDISTNANPRGRPVSRSMMTCTLVTVPNWENASRSWSS